MSGAYYNEHDPFAAAWLRNLIAAGHIAPGDVDERDIQEVQPNDVRPYTQVHLFAGIGGWSYALRLAGWPDDRPVWTGSCPCQPFSAAGKRQGAADERHLWPEMLRLIRECKPGVVFGEQVASTEVVGTGLETAFVAAVRAGDYAKANRIAHELYRSASLAEDRRWLDGVQADLGDAGYSLRADVLGAHSVGAPHIRQRLWWVGDAERRGREGRAVHGTRTEEFGAGCGTGGCGARWLDSSIVPGLEGHAGHVYDGQKPGRINTDEAGSVAKTGRNRGAWDDYVVISCGDGKSRRLKPGLDPLVDGLPGRVGLLRGYGNAIVPQVAAAFVTAYMDARQ